MDFINTLMPNFSRLSGELLECIGQFIVASRRAKRS